MIQYVRSMRVLTCNIFLVLTIILWNCQGSGRKLLVSKTNHPELQLLLQACKGERTDQKCYKIIQELDVKKSFQHLRIALLILLQENPDNANFQRWLGYTYLQESKYARALYHTRQSLTLDPENYASRVNLARLGSILGQDRQAVQEYLALLDLYPGKNELHMMLAQHYYRRGNMDEAQVQIVKAYTSEPGNARIACTYGEVQASLGHHAAAWQALQKCVHSYPNRMIALEYWLQSCIRLKKFRLGWQKFHSLAVDRRTRRMAVPGALLAFHRGKHQTSIELWQKVDELGLSFSDRDLFEGISLARLQRNKAALQKLRKFIETSIPEHPARGVAYFNLAMLGMRINDKAGSATDLKKACKAGYFEACTSILDRN